MAKFIRWVIMFGVMFVMETAYVRFVLSEDMAHDWATEVRKNPWDFDNIDDLADMYAGNEPIERGAEPGVYRGENVEIRDGTLSFTTAGEGDIIHCHFFLNTDGKTIDTSLYSLLTFRAKFPITDTIDMGLLCWPPEGKEEGLSFKMEVKEGWDEYQIDFKKLPWKNTLNNIRSLRIDFYLPPGIKVKIDWVKLLAL